MNRNYQQELEKIIQHRQKKENTGGVQVIQAPRLLVHSCCAPCSSYVLEYLRQYFRITVLYYNPNISEQEEYGKRAEEQKRLIAIFNKTALEQQAYPITMKEEAYLPSEFYSAVKGKEQCPEGGERCLICYELRLRKTAKMAAEDKYDYFTTTLTISPLKKAEALNTIGERLAGEYGTVWLPSDFKKKNGYKRSTELSAEYHLYRQDYCGCIFSKKK